MTESELKKEELYLAEVEKEILHNITNLGSYMETEKKSIDEQKEDFRNTANLSGDEKNLTFDEINRRLDDYALKVEEHQQNVKMQNSPYFGMVEVEDFGAKEKFKNYIGYSSLLNHNGGFYILDWRAPIASFFYDYEKGKVSYNTVNGKFDGEILNKRQYKIKKQKLLYAFDSDLKVDDELLQQELLKHTNDKMKNIVVSIQREQNKIIRSNEKQTVVVLGVAGSGKTSIALHRIAYLLYKLKGDLKSTEVLILSPNKIFGDYISDVLPELNEQNAIETTLIQIAKQELKIDCLENKQQQVERILSNQKISETYKLKNSFQFFKELYEFTLNYCNSNFIAQDIKLGKFTISKQKIETLYGQNKKYLPFKRIEIIVENILESNFEKYKKIQFKIQDFLKLKLQGMFKNNNPIMIYNEFLNKYNLKVSKTNGKIKNEDVYPILLIHYFIYGCDDYTRYKHMVIDEMQDYNPCQYFLISSFFPCVKTILGDENQSVSLALANNLVSHINQLVFTNAEHKVIDFETYKSKLELLNLKKSYRNSDEICKLACCVMNKENTQIISRSGQTPKCIKVNGNVEFISTMCDEIKNYQKYFKNIAIITKTEEQAIKIFNLIKSKIKLKLITAESDSIENGVVILSAYQSKGLEFDAVVLFNVNENNYCGHLDQQLLYVAITRALHGITILHTKEPSKFIRQYFKLGETKND